MLGQMAMLMKGALFLFVSFIFFVAIVIIMNTLSMAALERISEIGMMRAVGARKSFISRMFLIETLVLAFTFGSIGIAAGFVTLEALTFFKLTTTNEMLQILYGGDTLRPTLDLSGVIMCFVQLLIVTGIAVIYPIRVAKRITAMEAVSRE